MGILAPPSQGSILYSSVHLYVEDVYCTLYCTLYVEDVYCTLYCTLYWQSSSSTHQEPTFVPTFVSALYIQCASDRNSSHIRSPCRSYSPSFWEPLMGDMYSAVYLHYPVQYQGKTLNPNPKTLNSETLNS